MNSFFRALVILTALLTFTRPTAAIAQSATTIDVRSTVTLPAGIPVLLKHIATVSGPDADRLATIVILHADQTTSSNTTKSITREALRATLENAAVNWARTLLRGGTTTLTFAPNPAADAAPTPRISPTPAPTIAAAPAALPSAAPSSVSDPRSLRSAILNALIEAAGPDAAPGSVSLRTDALPHADQQLLADPIPPSWTCHIKVMGATPSGRTTIRIEAFDTDRVALSKTLSVDALVRREVLVVGGAGGIAREQPIEATDLRTETRLLTITESARTPALTAEQVATGFTAPKRRLDAGKIILPADLTTLKSAVIVKRGDDVQVTCLAGGIMLKSKAKALASAREGETVQLQLEGSKKIITARVSGPGKAVLAPAQVEDSDTSPTPNPRPATTAAMAR